MSENLNAELKIEYVPIADVKPYEGNPRVNDAAIPALKESIKDFRFSQPITVDADGVVITGHTRLAAAKALGMETVPVMRRTDLTPEQVKALRLADNKVAELSEWDFDKLRVELADIPSLDMASLGFDLGELGLADADVGTGGQTDADAVPEVDEGAEAASKRGEVYLCGRHRLMCGDSANAVDWGRLTAGEKADMVFTDPPYGVAVGDKNKMLNAIQPSNRVESNIANDAISIDDLKPILKAAFENLRENTADDACWFVTSPQGGDLCMMMTMMADAGVPVRHVLMWRKNTATFSMGRLDYDYAHEPIFYTWTKSHHNFRGGDNRTSVWEYDKPRKCDLHPTMKPVELVANAVMDGTEPGMTVADAFGGSGTTMIAAERTGRKAWLMELDPHYCDVIRRRWAEFVHGEGCDWKALTPAEGAL
jgi:site-specific DNA-methyltransferase (adenine-specific)